MKNLLLTALLLALPHWVQAAADPVTIETKWIVKTFSITTTSVSGNQTFDIGGFGSMGYAVIGNTQTANGVDGTTYGTQVIITSATTNVVGFSYSALVVGTSAQFQIVQTVRTPPPHGITLSSGTIMNYNSPYPANNYFNTSQLSTSSVITLPAGIPVTGNFEAQTSNPIFIFSGLQPSATLYFLSDFGVPRPQ